MRNRYYNPESAQFTQPDPIGLAGGLNNFFSFTRDNTGALTGMTMPGGITDQMRYDVEGRLQWRRETSPAHAEPLQEEIYTHDARNKLVSVSVAPSVGRNAAATFWQWYSGLGNLVMTHWGNQNDSQWQREGFTTDGLGNVVRRQTFSNTWETAGVGPYYEYSLDLSLGRVDKVSLQNTGSNPAYDETFNNYDPSGNLASWYQGVTAEGSWRRTVDARSYYGMDERLRALQKFDVGHGTLQGKTSGLFEEYRYDPLGRRVGVLTRRPNEMCNQPTQCYTSTTFFVWAGDNLLWEIKNTDGAAPPESRGRVSYFQAGGIDRPLVIWKSGVGSIVTHQNWRGQFSRGTWGAGTGRLGQSSDCAAWPSPVECVPVPWPGWNTNAWHEDAAKPKTVGTDTYWLGSLSVGMRDASGQMYMRNRYYNPATGQFTQPDPIGLAGGLNSYGFAAGDPVSYSDPYGLCAVAGAAGSIAMGSALATASGSAYRTRHAVIDGVAGAVCIGTLVRGIQVLRHGRRALQAARATRRLSSRADDVHRALDPIAQRQRTTAVLQTSGGDVVAGGARDLTPAQRALLGPNETAARLPGAHAEVTALQHAQQAGHAPEALAASRPICAQCAKAIEESGGKLTSPTTAVWSTP